MAVAVTFNTRITFNQLVKLTRQLSPVEKRRLVKLLEKETTLQNSLNNDSINLSESQLTVSQRKTWLNISQGFDDLQQIKEGKQQTQSADDFLKELAEEGYL